MALSSLWARGRRDAACGFLDLVAYAVQSAGSVYVVAERRTLDCAWVSRAGAEVVESKEGLGARNFIRVIGLNGGGVDNMWFFGCGLLNCTGTAEPGDGDKR